MKLKRTIFVLSLIVLFIFCLWKMNEHYDELARYPYELTDEERVVVLEHFDTEEINYLVAQKIQPSQFLPYITTDGFELTNTLWYDTAYHARKESKAYIISFINKYRNRLEYGTLKDMLSNYSYNVLTRFFDEGDGFEDNVKLIANPKDILTVIGDKETVYNYEPNDLVSINDLPHDAITSGNDVTIRKEVVKPLHELAKAAKEINQKTFGDMEIVAGYLSYEDQFALYDAALTKYKDEVFAYWDYPGRNEYQLGYTIQLKPKETDKKKEDTKATTAKNDKSTTSAASNKKAETNDKATKAPSEEEQEQAIWLKDNAYKYGFIIRYPKQAEDVTGKRYQPYTLRYVGKDLAKFMHDKNLALEEINQDDFKE